MHGESGMDVQESSFDWCFLLCGILPAQERKGYAGPELQGLHNASAALQGPLFPSHNSLQAPLSSQSCVETASSAWLTAQLHPAEELSLSILLS